MKYKLNKNNIARTASSLDGQNLLLDESYRYFDLLFYGVLIKRCSFFVCPFKDD